MSDDTESIVKIVLWAIVAIVVLAFIANADNNAKDKQCKEQFGQEWQYKYAGHYSTSFCVNKNGEVKYPL